MKHVKLGSKRGSFANLAETHNCQAIKMTLRPGESTESRPGNEHPRCEQWLFVVTGTGEAVLGARRRKQKLSPQSLLLIEKGELHKITNTGQLPLVTLNLYSPPAYNSRGKPRSSAKRRSILAGLLGD